MQHFKVQTTTDKTTLFEGHYKSIKHCLEDAIQNNTPLCHADLSGTNLTNANLDDAILPYADFTNTNLSGANISESYLKGSVFKNTALYNTCFAYSNMTTCNFQSASFGATDICGAIISGAEFSSLSCFSLDFQTARQMDNCIFISHDGHINPMSKPPIVIKGFHNRPIIMTDHNILAGHNRINLSKCETLAKKLSVREIKKRLEAA